MKPRLQFRLRTLPVKRWIQIAVVVVAIAVLLAQWPYVEFFKAPPDTIEIMPDNREVFNDHQRFALGTRFAQVAGIELVGFGCWWAWRKFHQNQKRT
jgi:hypothetical protein